MLIELEGIGGLAARQLARRLLGDLGPRLVAVQVVGQRLASPLPHRGRDLDVLVILAEQSQALVHRVLRIGAEVEDEFEAGLAVKVTSPTQIERLGARGTPVWQLLEAGIPLLGAPEPLPALPAPRPPPVHQLTRDLARDKALSQLRSAEALLDCGQLADAVSLAFASMRSAAKAWLPRERLNGARETELPRILLEALPGGRQGEWGQRVTRTKRLRDDLDLGCRELQDPETASRAVGDARELLDHLLGPAA